MTHEVLTAKALARAEVREEFNALEVEFALLRRDLKAREQGALRHENKPPVEDDHSREP